MTSEVSAQKYHEYMLGSSFDRPIRGAFTQAVSGLLGARGTVLDFGAGTGIDSRTYVQLGYEVRAYDASIEMRDYLAAFCRREIETGTVSIIDLDYPAFLGTCAPNGERVDAITANFAVLNLIPDPGPLFETFDRWLAPNGFVLVSVLNPYCVRGAWHWWWWRNLARFIWAGKYTMGADSRRTYRFGLPALRHAAHPHFFLSRIVEQANAHGGRREGENTPRSASAISLLTHVYMFLLFRRRPSETAQ